MAVVGVGGVGAGSNVVAGADGSGQSQFDAARSDAGDGGKAECAGSAAEGAPLSLAERIDDLERRITELEQSGNIDPAELEALEQELADLTAEASTAQSTGLGDDQAALDRLDQLQPRLNALFDRAAPEQRSTAV